MITKIENGKLIRNHAVEEGKAIYLKDGKIAAITAEELPFDCKIDAEGNYVSPGFIDIHTHGGGGYDYIDGVEGALTAMRMHRKHGTTTIYPSGMTCSREVLKQFIRDMVALSKRNEGGIPNLGGIHMEGPYFVAEQAGAQNPDYLRAPEEAEYREWFELGEGLLSRISFAPELPGSVELCDFLKEKGLVASMAHSGAIYEEILPSYEHGCKLVTHLYSAMNGVTRRNAYRRLGMVETAYLLDDIDAEIIADGCHLPPDLLKLIYKIKGPEHLVLVTDSMRGAGMPDGPTFIGPAGESTECIIEDGVAKLLDRSAFAGSVATTDRLVRTMVQKAGVPLPQAVQMMTETPARVMNLTTKGKLEEGFDADIVIFDEEIRICRVLVGGSEE